MRLAECEGDSVEFMMKGRLEADSRPDRACIMPNVHVGDVAPDFTALDDADRRISLADFRGKVVVLYFYPKDDTPG
jgi:hypothetical protein